jgi:hypothetical protein
MTDLLSGPFHNEPLAQALASRRPLDEVVPLLLESLVLVPVRVDDQGRRHMVTERNDAGAIGVPVFSSTDAVAAWNPETGVAVVEGAALLDMAPEVEADALLLDVAGPSPAIVSRAALTAIAGERGRRLAEGRQMGVGAPAEPPAPEVAAAVRAAVDATHGVAAAYLVQMAGHGTVPALVVGVELDDAADEAAVMPGFVRRLGERLPEGESIDAMPVAGSLLDAVRRSVPPIA